MLRPHGQLVEEAGCERTVKPRTPERERKEAGGGPEPSLARFGWNISQGQLLKDRVSGSRMVMAAGKGLKKAPSRDQQGNG